MAKKFVARSCLITLASINHGKTLKSYGVESIYEYHNNFVVEKITKTYFIIQHLVDSVSDEKNRIRSSATCAALMKQAHTVQLTNIFNVDAFLDVKRDDKS